MHLPCVVFFYPNFKKSTGNLCQLMFLFPLDNHGHRTAVRAALANDPNWISSYLSKILPMISKQVRGLGGHQRELEATGDLLGLTQWFLLKHVLYLLNWFFVKLYSSTLNQDNAVLRPFPWYNPVEKPALEQGDNFREALM